MSIKHNYKNVISLILAFVMIFNTVVVSADLGSCISGMEEKCESNKQQIEEMEKQCESISKEDEESRADCEAALEELKETAEKECSEDNYYTELCGCVTGANCGDFTTAELIDKIFGGGNITNPYEYDAFLKAADWGLSPTQYIDSNGLLSIFDNANEQNIADRLAVLKIIENINNEYADKVKDWMNNLGNDGTGDYSYQYQDVYDAFVASLELDSNCTSSTLACAIAKFNDSNYSWEQFESFIENTAYGDVYRDEALGMLYDQLQYLTEYKVYDAYLSRIEDWNNYYSDQIAYTQYIMDSFYEYRGQDGTGSDYDFEQKVDKPVNRNEYDFGPDVLDLMARQDYLDIHENAYQLYLQLFNDVDYVLTEANRQYLGDYLETHQDFDSYATALKIAAYSTMGAGALIAAYSVLPIGTFDFLDPIITGSLFTPSTKGMLNPRYDLSAQELDQINTNLQTRISDSLQDPKEIREAVYGSSSSPVIQEIIDNSGGLKPAVVNVVKHLMEDTVDPSAAVNYDLEALLSGDTIEFSVTELKALDLVLKDINDVFIQYVTGTLP